MSVPGEKQITALGKWDFSKLVLLVLAGLLALLVFLDIEAEKEDREFWQKQLELHQDALNEGRVEMIEALNRANARLAKEALEDQ